MGSWLLHLQGKSPWYTCIGGWVSQPQSQSGHGGEEKNSLPLLDFYQKTKNIYPYAICYKVKL